VFGQTSGKIIIGSFDDSNLTSHYRYRCPR
jgi:hypothetical protein